MDAFLRKADILDNNSTFDCSTLMVTSEFGKTDNFVEAMEKVLLLNIKDNTDTGNGGVEISVSAREELDQTLKENEDLDFGKSQ